VEINRDSLGFWCVLVFLLEGYRGFVGLGCVWHVLHFFLFFFLSGGEGWRFNWRLGKDLGWQRYTHLEDWCRITRRRKGKRNIERSKGKPI